MRSLFRRELLARHGGYRHGDFPEEYELWLRWLEAGAVMDKLPEVPLPWNDPRYQTEAFFRIKAGYLARCLARINPFHPRVVVAGAGRITRRRAERLLAHGIVIEAWPDIDPDKVGKTVAGRVCICMTFPGRRPVLSCLTWPAGGQPNTASAGCGPGALSSDKIAGRPLEWDCALALPDEVS